MEISIILAMHAAVAAIWIIDSRAIQYLVGRRRNNYMRQFKKHEKEHKRMLSSMDQELEELVKNFKEEQSLAAKAEKFKETNKALGLSDETIDILNKLAKRDHASRHKNDGWLKWEDFRGDTDK